MKSAIAWGLFCSAIAISACGSRAKYARDGGEVKPLSVRVVEWNLGHVDVGKVAAVAEDGDDLAVFGDSGAHVFVRGIRVASDSSTVRWSSAATIPAGDGNGRWLVAIDGDGHLVRVRGRTRLEPISDRYGFGDVKVCDVAAFGEGSGTNSVAFWIHGGAGGDRSWLALADGATVTRFDFGDIDALAGGGGRGAIVSHVIEGDAKFDLLFAVDPTRRLDARFHLPDAAMVAVDAHGRLYAATDHAVYAEDATGSLHLRYVGKEKIDALVASGDRVWFDESGDLGVIEGENGDVVQVSEHRPAGGPTRLIGSASGDVWSLRDGALLRFTRTTGGDATASAVNPREAWERDVRPIFVRVCSACHSAGGSANLDLSGYDAWTTKQGRIRTRVVERRSMPPAGTTMSEADRAAIDAWTRSVNSAPPSAVSSTR